MTGHLTAGAVFVRYCPGDSAVARADDEDNKRSDVTMSLRDWRRLPLLLQVAVYSLLSAFCSSARTPPIASFDDAAGGGGDATPVK